MIPVKCLPLSLHRCKVHTVERGISALCDVGVHTDVIHLHAAHLVLVTVPFLVK